MARSHSLSRLRDLVAVGVIGVVGVAVWAPSQLATLVGWIAAATVYLLRSWRIILTSDGDRTQQLATTEDDSRAVSGLLVVAAATTSLAGAALALHKAGTTDTAIAVALTATADSASETPKSAQAGCPGHQQLLSAGAAITDVAPGDVSLQLVFPGTFDNQPHRFFATAVETTPTDDSWDVIARGICVDRP